MRMKGTAFSCDKQWCFCHLCFYRAKVMLFMPQQHWLLSAPLWE